MAIGISKDHEALARTASEFLAKAEALRSARALLEAPEETLPPFWPGLVELGWLGIHVPEQYGGAGYGLPELVVVVEQLGRAVAPGPFSTTAIVSATIAAAGSAEQRGQWLPRLTDGTASGGIAVRAAVDRRHDTASGSAVVLAGGVANFALLPARDDVLLVDLAAAGVTIATSPNLDPTRRSARVALDGVAVEVLEGAGPAFVDITRTILAAEAVGVATECTQRAAEYAKERVQFGRPIATFQAVKHHCANMALASEMAASAVWDAARAAEAGGDELTYAAAVAAAEAASAADLCANLATQVHGGIALTWEHDMHLYLRRATALSVYLDAEDAARQVTDSIRHGVRRVQSVELPPEAEAFRDEVREFVASIAGLTGPEQEAAMVEAGYMVPHWPQPYGRDAGAAEQLIIEQELAAAGIERQSYSITGWILRTILQFGTDDQRTRFVGPGLRREAVWCQLFSEPDAGSDAAGVKSRATRVEGGWLVNGQKVWTSGAHRSDFGFATIRTNPDVPKHEGITTMVIGMRAPGVEIRPLRQTTGLSEFNEVFFNDVFVPDDDVIGPVDSGWTVARATLGYESVSIGAGSDPYFEEGELLERFDARPARLDGGASRLGRYFSDHAVLAALNLRSAHRAVAAVGPGPEGAMTKLLSSEIAHESVAIRTALLGEDALFMEGPGAANGFGVLIHRAGSIAGGSSEIKRNQIGERILGLPRDPLIK